MKKITCITSFLLGTIFGGLLVISSDFPIKDTNLEKAKLLCKDGNYKEARVDVVGKVKKITCTDGKSFIIKSF
jgi:hypothetical protein